MKIAKPFQSLSLLLLATTALVSGVAYGLYESPDPWPMIRHDVARTGATTSAAPDTNHTLWTYTHTQSISLPVIDDGMVFFKAYTQVFALDETTGVKIWESPATTGSVVTTPTYAEGKVYVGTNQGYIFCFDVATGTKAWDYEATTTGTISTPPTVLDSEVYFGTSDGWLYALNASNGLYLWRYTAADEIKSRQSTDGDLLFFGCEDGKVYALNISGSLPMLKWTIQTGGRIRSAPVVYGDRVFFGTSSSDHSIFAVDKLTGSLVWKYQFDSSMHIENDVAVADDVVYVAPESTQKVYALYANAAPGNYSETDPAIRKWSTTLDEYNPIEPVVADGKVFVCARRKLYALASADAARVWTSDMVSGSYFGGLAVADGRLFVMRGNQIICYGSAYPPLTYHYTVNYDIHSWAVILVINATPGDLDTSSMITLKKISYTLEGVPGTIGMSNITIPHQMLGPPYTVTVDGGLPQYQAAPVDNGTHTSLYFTYQQSVHTVEVIGTTVIPEFPSTILLYLMLLFLIIAVIGKKKSLA